MLIANLYLSTCNKSLVTAYLNKRNYSGKIMGLLKHLESRKKPFMVNWFDTSFIFVSNLKKLILLTKPNTGYTLVIRVMTICLQVNFSEVQFKLNHILRRV